MHHLNILHTPSRNKHPATTYTVRRWCSANRHYFTSRTRCSHSQAYDSCPALLLQGLADIPKPIQLARYTATAYHPEDASTDPTPPTLIEGAHSLPTTTQGHKCAWVYTLLGCLAAGGKVEGSGEWGTLQCRYCPVLRGGSTHLIWGDDGVAFMAWQSLLKPVHACASAAVICTPHACLMMGRRVLLSALLEPSTTNSALCVRVWGVSWLRHACSHRNNKL